MTKKSITTHNRKLLLVKMKVERQSRKWQYGSKKRIFGFITYTYTHPRKVLNYLYKRFCHFFQQFKKLLCKYFIETDQGALEKATRGVLGLEIQGPCTEG